MATSQPSEEPLPKALAYKLEHSSLLVISSNALSTSMEGTGQPCYQHDTDQDAELIHSTLTANNYIQKTMLICSSSKDCNKEGVLGAVEQQVSLASDSEGLFVLVYTGGACDNWDKLGLNVREVDSDFGDSYIDIVPDKSLKRYSLVLNDYQANKPETYLTGDLIGAAIRKSKPEQVQIILECPFADKIAFDIQESLRGCELNMLVSQSLEKVPCYLSTLKCSTFTYFFTFLMSKTQFIGGLFPLRSVFTRVQRCCEALSNLDLIHEGEWLKKNTSIPKAIFMTIPDRADEMVSEEAGDSSGDQTDGSFKCQTFITKYYNWSNKATVCNEAKDWVRAVTEAGLSALNDEGVLEGKVLESAIGSMMFNVATIQNAKKKGSIANSNIFVMSYILVVAAFDMADPNIELESTSLLTCATDYYMRVVLDNCSPNKTKYIIKLIERMKKDNLAMLK